MLNYQFCTFFTFANAEPVTLEPTTVRLTSEKPTAEKATTDNKTSTKPEATFQSTDKAFAGHNVFNTSYILIVVGIIGVNLALLRMLFIIFYYLKK